MHKAGEPSFFYFLSTFDLYLDACLPFVTLACVLDSASCFLIQCLAAQLLPDLGLYPDTASVLCFCTLLTACCWPWHVSWCCSCLFIWYLTAQLLMTFGLWPLFKSTVQSYVLQICNYAWWLGTHYSLFIIIIQNTDQTIGFGTLMVLERPILFTTLLYAKAFRTCLHNFYNPQLIFLHYFFSLYLKW